ncbi:bifunctional diaminohydroxyphosphoribosylaminopyrimidine deaminase/5-amino-6-(5-phosphoribosylamino)uracil reductase RibD [Cetobacterium sp. 8H]|uniref:bifunctional diaminohydroxyphosphoribosylaminopyrimidine deaminase/5-amino-6-(5-phosphoribosylamino)uracil reductase RibD n=1 Tax=Cetobacterium sp. 8H TaxID=2759681 RepID=UPI00163D12CF|nr:bifunctional diaminohydroxyphosphoribosylaminopyrimidine deaminase/5-amino-6-(5-phosphoribosylamino)uracil reductase RibD [Cetobacterium sp. 8H]MBC2851648.1 bifunctional diaminohydroxyphosphoribosylaminopyrimidine deaminase/5-amino-6-(5-phosphoribosylamino)uracil reductase RibD [Cetobacterium sp. 8H]
MHEQYMRLALEEAKKGIGAVNPNPLVGAVIVKDDTVLAKGYHQIFGGPHAEVNAIRNVENIEGSTIYVTLEPCSHFGKTPPCTQLIINSKIKKCVIATLDPNPLVSGRGVQQLKDAGIEVVVGILEKEAQNLNKVFFKYIQNKIPYIFIKTGITLDGKIATKNFSSKWITNAIAREKVQKYRNFFSGILVGSNTVLKDNPSLKCAAPNGRDPYRIIFDRNLTITEEYNIIYKNEDKKTILVVDDKYSNSEKYNNLKDKYSVTFIHTFKDEPILDILKKIGELGIDSILVEGGSQIISSFFKENLYDGGEFMVAPKILGDSEAIPFIDGFSPTSIQDCLNLENLKINLYDNNVGFEFYKEDGCLPV